MTCLGGMHVEWPASEACNMHASEACMLKYVTSSKTWGSLICITIDCRFQVFQRLSIIHCKWFGRLLLKTVESRFVPLNYCDAKKTLVLIYIVHTFSIYTYIYIYIYIHIYIYIYICIYTHCSDIHCTHILNVCTECALSVCTECVYTFWMWRVDTCI